MNPKIEFHYVNISPSVNEVAKNIENEIVKIDFDIEYIKQIMNEGTTNERTMVALHEL